MRAALVQTSCRAHVSTASEAPQFEPRAKGSVFGAVPPVWQLQGANDDYRLEIGWFCKFGSDWSEIFKVFYAAEAKRRLQTPPTVPVSLAGLLLADQEAT